MSRIALSDQGGNAFLRDALTLAALVVGEYHPRLRSHGRGTLVSAVAERAEIGTPGVYQCQLCMMVWDWPLIEPIAHRRGCEYLAALRVLGRTGCDTVKHYQQRSVETCHASHTAI